MTSKKQKLELTRIGRENRPKLEPRILLEAAQDQVGKQREESIASIKSKLTQKSTLQRLFTIRWRLA
jgi:hypothetical protein